MNRADAEQRLVRGFRLLYQEAGLTIDGEPDSAPDFTDALDDTFAVIRVAEDGHVIADDLPLFRVVLPLLAYEAALPALATRVTSRIDAPDVTRNLSDMYKAAQAERDRLRAAAIDLGYRVSSDDTVVVSYLDTNADADRQYAAWATVGKAKPRLRQEQTQWDA